MHFNLFRFFTVTKIVLGANNEKNNAGVWHQT